MSDLIKTAFFQNHLDLGAKMVPYSGFSMPVSYSGLKEEHNAVRNDVGMFDVSHMGEFSVRGSDALEFLQYITSNDVSALFDGKIQYSCMPNGNGGIVDDLLVYRKSEDDYLLVVNAGNKEKDWNNKRALLIGCGGSAKAIIQGLISLNISEITIIE